MSVIIGTIQTPATWQATTAYALGTYSKPIVPNNYQYKCTTAGTSGATEPTWPTTVGATVTDGTVVWTLYDVTLQDVSKDYLPAKFSRRVSSIPVIGGIVFQDFGVYLQDGEVVITGTEYKAVINDLLAKFIAGGEYACSDVWGNKYNAIIKDIEVPAEMGSDVLYSYTIKLFITEMTKLFGVTL